MKTALTKVIALLLLLCTFPVALFSCSSDDIIDNTKTESSQASESTNDATSESKSTENVSKPDAKGTITLFRNGTYVAKVIRAELASENDVLAYDELKSDLKSKTGKNVTTATDYVAVGTALDDSSAILVGETAYPESKSVYESLKSGEAVAKIVNNKYVIAFSNLESLSKLFEKLKNIIANANAEEIVIDSTWNIKIK